MELPNIPLECNGMGEKPSHEQLFKWKRRHVFTTTKRVVLNYKAEGETR